MNPCPCGYYGDALKPCTCSPGMVTKYQKRISGPLLDRIDIHIEVPRVAYDKLSDQRLGEPSEAIQKRVEAARETQRERFSGGLAKQPQERKAGPQTRVDASPIMCNADMTPAQVRVHCALDDTCRSLMKTAMSQLQLSARAYHRILKLARTIADLAGDEAISPAHLAEALQYRPRTMDGG
jgi:magnesium chelatase family protein